MNKNGKKLHSFIVSKYDWMEVNGDSKIVISQIGAYTEDGKWIKWVKLKEVTPFLNEYPITFKVCS